MQWGASIVYYSFEEALVLLDDAARIYGRAGYKADLQTRPETETLIERVLPCLCFAAIFRRIAVNNLQPNPDKPKPNF